MSNIEVHSKVGELTDILLSVPDDIGLYEICSDLKYDLHVSDEGEIKRITLDVLRIEREWAELKGLPTIGDICMFVWTPGAMEAYRK